ncbi:MAG: hypothetical protein ACFFEX_05530 [Candidatus Thorarchaeota archaeon]
MTNKKNRKWWSRIARRIAKRYRNETIYREYTRSPGWPSVAFWSSLYK